MAEIIFTLIVQLTIAFKIVIHLLETGDLTGVVSEKKTTHRNEGTHNKRPQGNAGNGSVNTNFHRLVSSHGFLAGVLGSASWADHLPMLGRSLNTHGGEYVGRGGKSVFVRLYLQLWLERLTLNR